MNNRFLSVIPILLSILTFAFSSVELQAQEKGRRGVLFPVTYKIQFPFGDLGDRFGFNNAVGLGMHYKFQNNWMIGVEGSYLFGNNITDVPLSESYVFTSSGNITDADGFPSEVAFFERGLEFSFRVSKLIGISKKNNESGILLQAGIGYLEHKIFVDESGSSIGFLQGDYVKGIDKYTNGISFVQSIGYLHLDLKKLTNVNISFEIIEAFTKNRRSFNFDEMRAATELRLDILLGVRFSLLLPIYGKNQDYYYN